MRNFKKKKPAFKIIVFLFLLCNYNFLNAQIASTYTIFNNNILCNVTIDYKIFDGGTCINSCSGSGIVISPSGSYVVPVSCLLGNVDIEIIITSPFSSIAVNYGSGSVGGGPWACYNRGAAANHLDTGTGICFTTYNIQTLFTYAKIW